MTSTMPGSFIDCCTVQEFIDETVSEGRTHGMSSFS